MELVLVVAIMAILAGVMTPMIFASRQAAKEAKCMAELDAISTACRAYYGDSNTMAGLDIDTLVSEGYLSQNKENPWGFSYFLANGYADTDADGRPDSNSYVIACTDEDADTTVSEAGDATAAKGLDHYVVVIGM